jgi:hypothetical protein
MTTTLAERHRLYARRIDERLAHLEQQRTA